MTAIRLNADKIRKKYGIKKVDGAYLVNIKCRRGHSNKLRVSVKYFFLDCPECKQIEMEIFKCSVREH